MRKAALDHWFRGWFGKVYPLARQISGLARDRRGGLGTLAAITLPVTVGALGLAVDLGRGLEQRMLAQRTADVAALAAAMAFQTRDDVSLLQPVARDLAVSNGLAHARVSAALLENFPANGDRSIRVNISMDLPFTLARAVGAAASYTISSEAFALASGRPAHAAPCFLALNPNANALRVEGGATISAPTCSVAAAGEVNNQGTLISAADIISGARNITNNWGTLQANSLRFATSFSNPPWNGNVPAANRRVNQATTLIDPWAGSSELENARQQIGAFTAIPAIPNPTTPSGTHWDFNWSPAAHLAPFRSGAVYNVPAGNYTVGRMSVAGGITVNFAPGSNITINNGFSNGGSAVNFSHANLRINGGFNSGSSGVTFGNGLLHIGSGTVSFAGTNRKGDGDVIINANVTIGGGTNFQMGHGHHRFGSLTVSGGGFVTMGNGDFQASTGVIVGGDSEISVGDGSFLFGPRSSNGNRAIDLQGGARLFMGDGPFSTNGHIVTAGGSRIRFPVTTNHFINGDMIIAGSALFGAGRYTIAGNFTNGTGGTTWPFTSPRTGITWGQTLNGVNVGGLDMAGVDVTFVLGGTVNLAGGARTRLIAPTRSVAGGQIRDMLIHSLTSANTNWAAGAHSVFVGTIYLPNSQVTMSGGTTTLSSGQCFTLIANRIAATGGAAAGSACGTMEEAYGNAGGGNGQIRLVA